MPGRQIIAIAHNLLVARTALDMTQLALAKASTVSRATIAQLEAGSGDPKLSTLHLLAGALAIHPMLLLLSREELHSLTAVTGRPEDAPFLADPVATTMRHLVSTGTLRSRLEAARLGIALAGRFPLPHSPVAAAIGSFHLPGAGTLAAIRFAATAAPPASALAS